MKHRSTPGRHCSTSHRSLRTWPTTCSPAPTTNASKQRSRDTKPPGISWQARSPHSHRGSRSAKARPTPPRSSPTCSTKPPSSSGPDSEREPESPDSSLHPPCRSQTTCGPRSLSGRSSSKPPRANSYRTPRKREPHGWLGSGYPVHDPKGESGGRLTPPQSRYTVTATTSPVRHRWVTQMPCVALTMRPSTGEAGSHCGTSRRVFDTMTTGDPSRPTAVHHGVDSDYRPRQARNDTPRAEFSGDDVVAGGTQLCRACYHGTDNTGGCRKIPYEAWVPRTTSSALI